MERIWSYKMEVSIYYPLNESQKCITHSQLVFIDYTGQGYKIWV